jgi:hypothetical protein
MNLLSEVHRSCTAAHSPRTLHFFNGRCGCQLQSTLHQTYVLHRHVVLANHRHAAQCNYQGSDSAVLAAGTCFKLHIYITQAWLAQPCLPQPLCKRRDGMFRMLHAMLLEQQFSGGRLHECRACLLLLLHNMYTSCITSNQVHIYTRGSTTG